MVINQSHCGMGDHTTGDLYHALNIALIDSGSEPALQ